MPATSNQTETLPLTGSSRPAPPTYPLDSFFGPGATSTELAVQLIPAVIFATILLLRVIHLTLFTSVAKYILFFIFVFDVTGGVLTNSTVACKLWYHRPEKTQLDRFIFTLVHSLHILIAALFFRDSGNIAFFVQATLLLVAASVVVMYTPDYLKYTMGLVFVMVAFFTDLYVWTPTKGLEWFIPLMFLKICAGYHVPIVIYHPVLEIR